MPCGSQLPPHWFPWGKAEAVPPLKRGHKPHLRGPDRRMARLMEMTLVGGRGLSHLRCLGSLEEMPLRNQVEGRGLGALGGTSGLLGGADTMVTPICPRRMVATSPQGGLARLPTGWVVAGGRWTGLFWFWKQGLESPAVSKPQTPPLSKHFPLRQQSPWLPSQSLQLTQPRCKRPFDSKGLVGSGTGGVEAPGKHCFSLV